MALMKDLMKERKSASPPVGEVEALEAELLLKAIFLRYGHDLRGYRRIERRLLRFLREERISSLSIFQGQVLRDPECLARLLKSLFVKVTSLFRDPALYRTFRRQVVPLLRTDPFLRVWHAGCATGEEAYSLAILLEEEGLYDRSRIYATDIDSGALESAQAGVFQGATLKEDCANYLAAGGKGSLASFYSLQGGRVSMRESLKRNMIFSQHNLATDGSFNEFNVIFCRNVLIYFNKPLQERVHHLLYQSLALFGFLALGSKESLRFTPHESSFLPLRGGGALYRKTAQA
jgi:chemotaxis protein methyltransferase CheR